MRINRLTLIAVLAASGCGRGAVDFGTRPDTGRGEQVDKGIIQDADGDRLVDSDDPFPNDADIDDDYLDDLGERLAGTEADVPDTDGDGYFDGDEVLEGSDPVDAASLIHEGGWPYNRLKDDLGELAFSGPVIVGQIFPRHRAFDQLGHSVDLYDFAGGRQLYSRILVVVVGEAEPSGRDLGSWIAGGPDPAAYQPNYSPLRAAVDDGRVLWVTVVSRDAAGQPGGLVASHTWDQDFPHPRIPVLTDAQSQVEGAVGDGFPLGVLLDATTMLVLSKGPVSSGLLDAAMIGL